MRILATLIIGAALLPLQDRGIASCGAEEGHRPLQGIVRGMRTAAHATMAPGRVVRLTKGDPCPNRPKTPKVARRTPSGRKAARTAPSQRRP